MNKPSERIVVFVTPAQKRAISATADGLGISISELMRRAVLAFGATGDQVKAASIVDRLNAPREPDALAQVLRKAAKPLRERRASPARPAAPEVPGRQADPEIAPLAALDEAALHARTTNRLAAPADGLPPADDAMQPHETGDTQATTLPSALANVARGRDVSSAAHEIAQAVARLSGQTPAPDAAFADTASAVDDEPLQSLGAPPFVRPAHPARSHDDADAHHDGHSGGVPEDGKFA